MKRAGRKKHRNDLDADVLLRLVSGLQPRSIRPGAVPDLADLV